MRSIILAMVAMLCWFRPAAAVFQFEIHVSDLENVDCWESANYAATVGWIHLYNMDDFEENYTVQAAISLGGSPLAFHFLCDADVLIDCENPDLMYGIDHVCARFGGPGFFYEVDNLQSRGYECGPAFPVRIIAPPGGICYDQWFLPWDHNLYPDGRVGLTGDCFIPAGVTQSIEAGMEIIGESGARLFIDGSLEAIGSNDAWITFHGDHWGGLIFGEGSNSTLSHCIFSDVDSPDDGGALTVGNEAVVHLDNCLIDHNTTTGAGGAAFIADGGSLIMYRSTVSHNSGNTGGGIHLAGGSAYFESNMSLITFNGPVQLTGTGFSNVLFTDLYPGEPLDPWNCDPGYVDAPSGDFHVSYWSLTDPEEVNCIIDISVNELENDPDGTPGDLGAFPFDQHQVLNPAADLVVADRDNDNGGFVLLSFRASPNDGGPVNPITLYSLWERQPGMAPGQWLAVGSVAALNDAETVYTVQVPTLDDQWEGHENLHAFRVGAHSVDFGQPAWSGEVTGFSLDNIAPPAVTDFAIGDWYYDMWPPTVDLIDLEWDPSPAPDISHYQVLASLVDDIASASLIYEGPATQATWSLPFGVLGAADHPHWWVLAIDRHGNQSDPVHASLFYVKVDERATRFALMPNAPNPFNPSTRITFELAQPGEVRLEVFNLAGQRVALLVEGPRAAGRHELVFDGSGLPSGVYVYRLETPGFSDLKKMVLIK